MLLSLLPDTVSEVVLWVVFLFVVNVASQVLAKSLAQDRPLTKNFILLVRDVTGMMTGMRILGEQGPKVLLRVVKVMKDALEQIVGDEAPPPATTSLGIISEEQEEVSSPVGPRTRSSSSSTLPPLTPTAPSRSSSRPSPSRQRRNCSFSSMPDLDGYEDATIAHLCVESWRNPELFRAPLLLPRDDLRRDVEKLLRAVPPDHGACQPMASVTVVSVEWISHPKLWERYTTSRASIEYEMSAQPPQNHDLLDHSPMRAATRSFSRASVRNLFGIPPEATDLLLAFEERLSRECDQHSTIELRKGANEVMLLHGAADKFSACEIAEKGFQDEDSRYHCKGVYFGLQSCGQWKAQGSSNKDQFLLISRVVLGRIEEAAGASQWSSQCHSLMAKPDGERHTHWKFIVPGEQAYPEFLVQYIVEGTCQG